MGNETLQRVVVAWPDGPTYEYDSLEVGNRHILTPGAGELVE